MRLKAVSVRCVELFTQDGTSLGHFFRQESWQGLHQLRAVNSDDTIIVNPCEELGTKIFSPLFGEARTELEVVMDQAGLLVGKK